MATVNSFPLTTTPIATVLQSLNYALYKATSTTSLAIEVAEKVFVTQAGKDFAVGDFVIATSDADAANFMSGQITAYASTSLTVDVTTIGGTGTLADWTIRLSGPPGEQGEQGEQGPSGAGDLTSTNNLSDVDDTAAAFANIKQAATDEATGVVELATDGEAQTGTDTARAITPANLTAAGIKQGKHAIEIPAGAMRPGTTSGALPSTVEAATNDQTYPALDFDASADEYAHFNFTFPKSWNLGTLTFVATWTTTATDSDGVAWGLQAVAVGDGDPIDAAWGTAVVVTDDAQSAAGDILVTAESGALTVGGTPADGKRVFFRVFRDVSDANDDMTEDARLIGLTIFYTINAATDA